MPSTLEIKARINDLSRQTALVKDLAGMEPQVFHQEDTFFNCDNGRLKLRESNDGAGQIIFYRRADTAGPAESSYVISTISDPVSLKKTLSKALGIVRVVRKRRQVYLVGLTQVHLDQVEGLGSFIELKVALEEGQSVEQAHQIAEEFMAAFGIRGEDLVPGAYIDIL